MQRIFEIIRKDLKEYYRESMTFKLVILSPILIIAIFGLIFSEGVPSTINLPVSIAICSMDEGLPSGFVQSLQGEKWVQVEEISGDCERSVPGNITNGRFKGGVVIAPDFMENVVSGNESYMDIYVDNSLVGVDSIIRGYLWKVLQEYSGTFVDDPLSVMKSEFYEASASMRSIGDSLSLSDPIEGLKSNVDDITSGLLGFDTDSYIKQVQEMKQQLASASSQVDGTQAEIHDARTNIADYREQIIVVRADLVEYDSQVVDARDALAGIYAISCDTGVPLFPDMAEACDDVENAIAELNAAHNDLQARINDIDEMNEELGETDAALAEKEQSLLETKNQINAAQSDLSEMEGGLNQLDEIRNDTEEFSSSIDTYQSDAMGEEAGARTKLYNFSDSINSLLLGMTTLPLSPVEVSVKNVFEDFSFLDFIIPSLITFLIMFSSLFLSSTTIIAERKSGTLTRNLLTPTSLASFMTGKIMSVIIVGVAEIGALLLIGNLAFGVALPGLLPQLAICIVLSMLAFVCIGMFIGIWSDSGTTAVMISITLMVMLLFVSGILVPNELLPMDVVNLGSALPLSNVLSSIKSLFVYNTLDVEAITYLAVLGIAGMVACILSIRRKTF